ncbi:MAG: polyprenyl synthetase family protein [Gemmatimonadota bacterium]|nr:polyprenyl synthetase family protein [Gemmatimonadota bacterium]MDH3427224.1 polyprenyl synthetase family protein [Gemmatimonadota bacterium]
MTAAGFQSDPIAWYQHQVDATLPGLLDELLADVPSELAEPIRYAVLAPGKRIRPLLLMAAFKATGGEAENATRMACSVELVHAYSLVHDDLPCMDDDVLRRGRPTLHVVYGVPAAVLAGAAMMPLAVQAVGLASGPLGLSAEQSDHLVARLTAAAGGQGMVGGQLLDLRAEGRAVSPDELEQIHEGKTARLIAASAAMGAVAAGGSRKHVDRLERFGMRLGLAFQAIDDILDLRGTTDELGKVSGRDSVLQKATYPGVHGLPEAERLSRELVRAAEVELDGLPQPHDLRLIADWILARRH